MRAGALRHRVAIQTDTTSQDSDGGVTHSWVTDATVWAEIKPLTGTESIDGQQVVATATHQVRIRYYSGALTPVQQLIYGSRVFGILQVINRFERNREMIMVCKEGV